MSERKLQELHDILSQERSAALASDFDALVRIGTKKEAVLRKMKTSGMSVNSLKKITSNIERNQGIIASCIAGVKAAQSHIHAARAGVNIGTTYNQHGGLNSLGCNVSNRSKRL